MDEIQNPDTLQKSLVYGFPPLITNSRMYFLAPLHFVGAVITGPNTVLLYSTVSIQFLLYVGISQAYKEAGFQKNKTIKDPLKPSHGQLCPFSSFITPQETAGQTLTCICPFPHDPLN